MTSEKRSSEPIAEATRWLPTLLFRRAFRAVSANLPPIFARHVTEHALQVQQGLLVDFGTREVGTQPRMQLAQVLVPPADLAERRPRLHEYGMLRVLHAVLAFDAGRCEKGCNF